MKVIKAGHKYELENFENKEASGQTIQFIEKEPKEAGSKELKTVNDGTTNEEILKMLIDRLRFLGEKLPSNDNDAAVHFCQQALSHLEFRTRERKERGVEGTMNA